MITMKELIGKHDLKDLPQEHQDNLYILLERVNNVRSLWGKSMTVTSGYRSMEEHLAIYAKKGITDKTKIPTKSKHLFGQAVDIFDPDLSLTKWLKENNSQRLIDIKFWCEEGNKNWVHFQISPPNSGNRWFLP